MPRRKEVCWDALGYSNFSETTQLAKRVKEENLGSVKAKVTIVSLKVDNLARSQCLSALSEIEKVCNEEASPFIIGAKHEHADGSFGELTKFRKPTSYFALQFCLENQLEIIPATIKLPQNNT
ncbi:hypothetical protein D5086_016589 [Populus alba]|uniref:Uncharacterized protein n=1 Tax=Populus alba TaxID=43335 RepID=A0ACC4BV06_POPAL